MAKQRYEHLIKPLSSGRFSREEAVGGQVPFTQVPGVGEQTFWLNGRENLEGMDISFTWATHNDFGLWHGGRALHSHPYPEVHFYVGLDTAAINYLGAEIETRLGEEQEVYTFSEPSVIIIPAGLPHGPTVTKRIYSPRGFGFYSAALTSSIKTGWLESAAKAAAGSKYKKLVKPLKDYIVTQRGKSVKPLKADSPMQLGPGNADHLAWLYGKDLEGLAVNCDWGFFSSPGLWHRGVGAHVHDSDEVLVFAGTDPARMNYLGAEIEIDMGKEHERYLIDKPSVVVLPAGTPHGPIVTRWVDRPFALFSINRAAEPGMKFVE